MGAPINLKLKPGVMRYLESHIIFWRGIKLQSHQHHQHLYIDNSIHTWNPAGNGSCCMVSLISLPGLSSSITASWCVARATSLSFTLRIRSPIRNLPHFSAIPPGTIWNQNRNTSQRLRNRIKSKQQNMYICIYHKGIVRNNNKFQLN